MVVGRSGLAGRARLIRLIFASAIVTSAMLVFFVEPMITKMLLPQLGGSPAVWNTSLAFFQTVLLLGYLYAHLLQRLASLRLQLCIHLLVLTVAAFSLPVGVGTVFGAPPMGAPIGWLLGMLCVSIGAPFAALSATAPLLQAWYVQALPEKPQSANPYVLYGASNFGSMLALVAYPILVEPVLDLRTQSQSWTGLYLVFFAMILSVAAVVWRSGGTRASAAATPIQDDTAVSWAERIRWLLLAAVPSSLMLGVTTHISTDVASVPLLWVIPLALYLVTFIISFQDRPLIAKERALLWQSAFVTTSAGLLCLNQPYLYSDLTAALGSFFFCALVCHQALAASRPHARHLTEFYLLMASGGVLGGMFNAFLAPLMFNSVAEFPLVLALAGIARPSNGVPLTRRLVAIAAFGIAAAVAMAAAPGDIAHRLVPIALAVIAGTAALLVSGRALLFTAVVAAMCIQSVMMPPDRQETLAAARSFFGVNRVTVDREPALGGAIHVLFHGTTIHGAQALDPAHRCQPTTYYASATPTGQAYAAVARAHPSAKIGLVGLGVGTVAALTRPGDTMRIFEIDPEVERIARDPRYFTYLTECAKGKVDVVLGDARLTMAQESAGSYDLLHLDAFSGDVVPTHLLTTQAMKIYFDALKPNGILAIHISNRNFRLEPTVAAAAKAIGATALMQEFAPAPGTPGIVEAPTQLMVVARAPGDLSAFLHDPRWRPAHDEGAKAWTDDYTNILGALIK